jgi:outer membrane protein TolC
VLAASPAVVNAQASPPPLDSLVSQALAANPAIHAAMARVKAAEAGVGPAGARPDLMLMAGVQNLPVSDPGFSDLMTMKMIGLSQTFPYPGKLALRTRAARNEVAAADAGLEATRLEIATAVKTAYYELAYIDRARAIVERNATVLGGLIRTTEAQYSVGTGRQADVLRARTEAARLGDDASGLEEERRGVLARLNAALDRPSTTPVEAPTIPARLLRAAAPDSSANVHFASTTLGARAADSPLLPLDSLQTLAETFNPLVRGHVAQIAAQRARVALARKAALPDFDVSVSYGQRQDRMDMVSAIVSIPLPLQKGRKQNQQVAAAEAELAALEAEHHRMVNAINAEIAQRVSDLEHARTQLALSMRAILPQASATFASATAAYQVGRLEFTAVMDAQASVFNAETAYYRSLTNFAKSIAELERMVGTGVLR